MVLTSTIFLMVLLSIGYAWVNILGRTFKFECPEGEYIYSMTSTFSRRGKDRFYNYGCRKGAVIDKCSWTKNDVNELGNSFQYGCPGQNSFITGIESWHSNKAADRGWKFKCCKQDRQYDHKSCINPGRLNEMRALLDYQAPEGYAIAQITSGYSAISKDRTWGVYLCKTMKCEATKITILDDLRPRYSGRRIVGLTTSQGCAPGEEYTLQLSKTDSVTESQAFTISSGKGFSISNTVSLQGGNGMFSIGASVEVGHAVTAERSSTKDTQISRDNSAGIEVEYDGRGAAMIIADVKEFTIDAQDVKVAIDVVCDNGHTYTENTTIKYKSRTFGATHFTTQIAKIKKNKCGKSTNRCLHRIDGRHVRSQRKVIDEFKDCFKGIGTVSK